MYFNVGNKVVRISALFGCIVEMFGYFELFFWPKKIQKTMDQFHSLKSFVCVQSEYKGVIKCLFLNNIKQYKLFLQKFGQKNFFT